MPISVQEVVNDPDIAQNFTIERSVGSFLFGVWKSATTNIPGFGTITNPTTRELEMMPEGDKIGGVIIVHSSSPIYGTRATGGVGGSSDIIIWNGNKYRVLSVEQYLDYKFYRCVCTRMKAN